MREANQRETWRESAPLFCWILWAVAALAIAASVGDIAVHVRAIHKIVKDEQAARIRRDYEQAPHAPRPDRRD